MTQKIIYVYGEDAKLIQAAEMVDELARNRAAQLAPKGTICPLISYDSEMEQAIMHQKRQLEDYYQRMHGLSLPPILVPAPMPMVQPALPNPVSADRQPLWTPSRKSVPTDMELAQLLLSRRTLRRQGETMFLFNGQFYVRLTDEETH